MSRAGYYLPDWADFEPQTDRDEVAYALMVAGVVLDSAAGGLAVQLDYPTADNLIEALEHRGFAVSRRDMADGDVPECGETAVGRDRAPLPMRSALARAESRTGGETFVPLAEWARLKGIEDLARELVRGWRDGFEPESESEIVDRMEAALGPDPESPDSPAPAEGVMAPDSAIVEKLAGALM